MAAPPASGGGRFSVLLLEGLDHYRKGKMIEAVRAWEEAYLLEPTNLRAREFLRSALERIHAHLGSPTAAAPASAPHPWLPPGRQQAEGEAPRAPVGKTVATTPRSSSPWDDGPSVALPDESAPETENSGAWQIHQEAERAFPVVQDDELAVWLGGAHELLALNDFSGALELTAKILQRKPDDAAALKVHDLCEHNLTLMFESKIGAMDARPRVTLPPDEIIWLNLDPRAGFVLAQIDSEVSFEDLYAICGLKRLDTARILAQLLSEGVITVDGQERAAAKRALHRR